MKASINTVFAQDQDRKMRDLIIDKLSEKVKGKDQDEIDSRIEIFCSDIAQEVGCNFMPVDKDCLELWFVDSLLNLEKTIEQVS